MKRSAGFTLVEVLVALVIMAVLAALAWRGVDAMLRARDSTQTSLATTTRLATVMAQWEQDLQSLYDDTSRVVPPIAFDGNSLRLARLAENGVQMVVWSVREGRWQRWASATVTRAADLQEQWLRSQQLQGAEAEQLRLLDGVEGWQIYYYIDGVPSNPQSTGNQRAAPLSAPPVAGTPPVAAPPQGQALPDGVQLVLRLNGHVLKRDIALVPKS